MTRRAWCLVLVLSGCDAGALFGMGDSPVERGLGTQGGYRDSATLIVGRDADTRLLDPAKISYQESVEVATQIFDRLVDLQPGQSEPEPALAVSWELVDGGRARVFELRRDVRFHDGTPLDADAVVQSFERQRDASHRYHGDFFYWQSYFGNVVSVDKVDQYRVRIELEHQYGPFLANMSIFSMSVVSPTSFVERDGELEFNPIGTGPFKLESWKSGRLVLERNDDYWGEKANFRRLVFQTIADPRQRMTALVSGDIDIVLNMPPEDRQFVKLHPRLRLHETTENAVTYLAMNTTRPPFNDVRVRRAINMAINKDPMVGVLWHGSAKPAHTPVPPSLWGHYAIPDPYPYDPAEARRLLDEAVDDGTLDPQKTYKLYVNSTPRQYLPHPGRLARAVQANLDDIALQVDVVLHDNDAHDRALKTGEYDLCIDGWVGDTGDPDNFLYLLLSGDNARLTDDHPPSNVALFSDPSLDAALILAQESLDPEERAKHYKLVQTLIHEQAPWVPIAHTSMNLAARSDIVDVHTGVSGLLQYQDLARREHAGAGR